MKDGETKRELCTSILVVLACTTCTAGLHVISCVLCFIPSFMATRPYIILGNCTPPYTHHLRGSLSRLPQPPVTSLTSHGLQSIDTNERCSLQKRSELGSGVDIETMPTARGRARACPRLTLTRWPKVGPPDMGLRVAQLASGCRV